MALETSVTYLGDLNPAWPTGTDGKAQGDDHIRYVKAGLKQSFPGFTGAVVCQGTSTGSSNAYVMTPATALPTLVAGMGVVMTPNFTNTGAATLNISTLGAKSIKRISGVDVVSGEIVSGQPIYMIYDGTQFVIPFPTYANLAATSFSAVLPSQSGNAGKFITTSGTAASWDWDGFKGRTSTTTGSYTFGASDNFARMKWLAFSDAGTVTLPLAAVSTSGAAKYAVWIGNEHATGIVTLQRSGGDTINGATSLKIGPQEVWHLQSDGSSAYAAIRIAQRADTPQVIVEEQYASGTGPTSGTAGSYNTRNLNTIVRGSSIVSVSGGAVTFPPGVWHLRAEAVNGGESGSGRIKIRNSTDSSDIALGMCIGTNAAGGGGGSMVSTAEGVMTITSSKAIVISHFISGSNTFGIAQTTGDANVYARLVATWLGGA